MQDLGTTIGNSTGTDSEAYAVSADGRFVVGYVWNPTLNRVIAFRWNPNNGMTFGDLGNLGGMSSKAYGISPDGNIVVGNSTTAEESVRAFRWNAVTRMANLGLLPDTEVSEAFDASQNGTYVVGTSRSAGTNPRRLAFLWSQTTGMQDLNVLYAPLLRDGSVLNIAHAISPDGRYIVGQGYNAATGHTEAFLLDTLCVAHNGDVNNDGCVDDADLLAVLFAFGSIGQNLGRVDVNCDNLVDDADLLMVLFNFGNGC
jgi:probable HAF family extracellular repeat protein